MFFIGALAEGEFGVLGMTLPSRAVAFFKMRFRIRSSSDTSLS